MVQSINSWLNWWVQRRFNLFPIFRGYCISSLNLAEIGHSTLKRKKQLMLVRCCLGGCGHNDVAGTGTYSFFLQGLHKSMGKGPYVAQLAVKEKKCPEKEEQRLSGVLQSWCVFHFRKSWTGMFHTI